MPGCESQPERPLQPSRQQVLSISELRKTGNEVSCCGGCEGRGIRLPKAVHGFFTKDGATQKKNLVLVNFGCKRAWVGMLVSIPFRDVRMSHGEIIRRATILLHSSNAEYGAGLQSHFKKAHFATSSRRQAFFAFFRISLRRIARVDDFRKVRKT